MADREDEKKGARRALEGRPAQDPASPYHEIHTPTEGLSPQGGGRAPQEGGPPRRSAPDIDRDAQEKIDQERTDLEHEAAPERRDEERSPA